MSQIARTALVAVIWFSMALAAIGVADGSSSPELIVIPISVALLMTIMLVVIPEFVIPLAASRDKAKRQPHDRLGLLLELMNEDERAAFKAVLQQRVLDDFAGADDGELPADDATLAALLDAEHGQRAAQR